MALKKPIEIIRHPIEVDGAICSVAKTTDRSTRSIEWESAKDGKDGYWKESEKSIGKIVFHNIEHKILTDAERINEGITPHEWIAQEIRKDKTPSHLDRIESTGKRIIEEIKAKEQEKALASETKLQKISRWVKYILTEKQY